MTPFGWFEILTALYIVWVITACGTLLMNRRSPTATLAWMFAFVALPFVSGFYYLFFGPRRLHRRRVRYKIARGLVGEDVSAYLKASCGQRAPRLGPDAAALAAVGQRLDQGLPTFATGVMLLDGGDAYFAALERAIAAAAHHVHIEYYIWEPDAVGTRFRDLLVAARERGVRVRVLYDAVGSPDAGTAFWAPLREAGGDVLTFNPMRFSAASINFANFRTHRKIVVCDGALGFLGGMNLHAPAREWRDSHAQIDGEPARRLQRLFLENWIYSGGNFMLTAENLAHYFPPFNLDARLRGNDNAGAVQILASGPDDERAPIHAFFLAAISTARTRVWIETPYLIPDEPLESALRVAVLRGIDVKVIVPEHGDSRLVTAASHTYCEALGMDAAYVSRIVRRFRDDGLATSIPDPKDARISNAWRRASRSTGPPRARSRRASAVRASRHSWNRSRGLLRRCCEWKLPVLADQAAAEAAVLFLLHQLEAFLLVDAARGAKDVVGPEHELAIAARPGGAHALAHQRAADAMATGTRLDQQQAKLRDRFRPLHEEDASDALALALRDPALLAPRAEFAHVAAHDLGDESFESRIPSVLLCVNRAVPRDDPAEVARPRIAQAHHPCPG